jgi:hypothetical protein
MLPQTGAGSQRGFRHYIDGILARYVTEPLEEPPDVVPLPPVKLRTLDLAGHTTAGGPSRIAASVKTR